MAEHSLKNLYGDPDRDVYRGIMAAVRAAELPDEAINYIYYRMSEKRFLCASSSFHQDRKNIVNIIFS